MSIKFTKDLESLNVSGSITIVTGSGQFGNIYATASYAVHALSASNVPATSSYANQANSASYAFSASYGLSASYALEATSASYALSASYGESASYANASIEHNVVALSGLSNCIDVIGKSL